MVFTLNRPLARGTAPYSPESLLLLHNTWFQILSHWSSSLKNRYNETRTVILIHLLDLRPKVKRQHPLVLLSISGNSPVLTSIKLVRHMVFQVTSFLSSVTWLLTNKMAVLLLVTQGVSSLVSSVFHGWPCSWICLLWAVYLSEDAIGDSWLGLELFDLGDVLVDSVLVGLGLFYCGVGEAWSWRYWTFRSKGATLRPLSLFVSPRNGEDLLG